MHKLSLSQYGYIDKKILQIEMRQFETGFVLGKFCPLHRGHMFLIDTATECCERLYIVVDNIMDNVFPVSRRIAWVKEEYPKATVITQPHPLPQNPGETPDFWNIWQSALFDILPEKIDAVFASETYGERLAAELGAAFVMVDNKRTKVPISASKIREDILHQWHFISPSAQKNLQKNICIFGPESTGKSTLTHQLAEYFNVPYVDEYAVDVIKEKNGDICFDDMEKIVIGHHKKIMKALQTPSPLLFVDTDAIASKVWSNELFGKESPVIEEMIGLQHFDHYLLLDIDLPWVNDIHRYRPDERKAFFNECKHELEKRGKHYTIIGGIGNLRFQNALKSVMALF